MPTTDRILHAANVLVCVAGAAMAPGAIAAAGPAMGATLSLRELTRRLPQEARSLAQEIAEQLETTLAQTHLTDDHRRLITQMIELSPPSPRDIIDTARDPDALITLMLGKLPGDPAYTNAIVQDGFRRTVAPILQTLLDDPARAHRLEPAFQAAVTDYLAHIATQVDLLVAREQDRSREFGIKEGLLIALARRYAEGNPSDFASAMSGLELALEVAAKRPAALPSNTSDAVEEVIAEVDRLNDEGRLDDAAAEIDAAILASEAREAQEKSSRLRLFDKGIEQAILSRDTKMVVRFEFDRIRLEFPDPFHHADRLSDAARSWWETGQKSAATFHLETALGLLRKAAELSPTQEIMAMIQDNLGNVLANLATRAGDTAALQDAVAAHRAALEVYTPEANPEEWPATQINLGAALRDLGNLTHGTDKITAAISAYQAVLDIYTPDANPERWAATQNNLGVALRDLGAKTSDTGSLRKAISAYRRAGTVYTREAEPKDWAMIQNNLGVVSLDLGRIERDTKALHDAIAYFDAALEVRTRETDLFAHTTTMENLAEARFILSTLPDADNRHAHLAAALEAVDTALEIYTPEHTPYPHEKATGLRDRILAARDNGG